MTFQLNCGTPLSEQGDHLSSHFSIFLALAERMKGEKYYDQF